MAYNRIKRKNINIVNSLSDNHKTSILSVPKETFHYRNTITPLAYSQYARDFYCKRIYNLSTTIT